MHQTFTPHSFVLRYVSSSPDARTKILTSAYEDGYATPEAIGADHGEYLDVQSFDEA